ncbi:LLM class flavin-dependent oxidoreductase [Corynebacterium pacaense]|uniref:LLM class flavin-dependent oxidoreductase n=1 Tax=Corynebacterium pacaense TaxID=1816684 RepID=UPI0009BAA1CA|nr:LLM class flavin-dependent oxidoreductase [Corynebacterium pacaense]
MDIAFLIPGTYEERDPEKGLDDLLDVFEFGEDLGFRGGWVRQRHLEHAVSNALSFLAAASQRTSRIELGTGVIQIGYENPFLLASNAALVDALSKRRLQLGVSGGVPARYDLLGPEVFGNNPPRPEELGYDKIGQLQSLLVGDYVGERPTEIEAPGTIQIARIQPPHATLPDRLWQGGSSRGSAAFAAAHGLNFTTGNIVAGDGIHGFEEAQSAVLDVYEQGLPEGARTRVALGRVIVPTDSATTESREKYAALLASRLERTLGPHGERDINFQPDLIGSAEEIVERLLTDPALSRASELRLELPYEFTLDEYRQVLADFVEKVVPLARDAGLDLVVSE